MPLEGNQVYDMIFTPFGGDYSSYGQKGGEHQFFAKNNLGFTPNAPVTAPDEGALAPMAPEPGSGAALQFLTDLGGGPDPDSAPDVSAAAPSPSYSGGYDFDISNDTALGLSPGDITSGLAAATGVLGGVPGLGLAGQGIGAAIDASNANAALEAVGLGDYDVSGWDDFMSRGLTGLFGMGKSAQDQANEISGAAYGFVDPGGANTGPGDLGALGAIGPGGLTSGQAAALGIGQAAVGAGAADSGPGDTASPGGDEAGTPF